MRWTSRTINVQEANWLSSIYNFGRVVQNYREGNLGICATIRVRGAAHSMLTGENLVFARDEKTKCVLVERRSHKVIGFTAHLNPEHRKSLKLTE